MDTDKKRTYQEELRAACDAWWNDYEQATSTQNLVHFDWAHILYDFVKGVALDSFKNGVTVGKRKAAQDRGANGTELVVEEGEKPWTC